MADYEFDVFLSYETEGLVTGWLVKEFLPHLRVYLRQELAALNYGRRIKVFFAYKEEEFPDVPSDEKFMVTGIPLGEDWNSSLNSAIKTSRCMVGIWSPTYFQSDYCNREWYSFFRRATKTGKPVLFGASWHDGTTFPQDAKSLQKADLSKFAFHTGAALKEGRNYPVFLNIVQSLARHVALAVSQAPDFEDWPVDDGSGPAAPGTIGLTRL
jgi:hypothetical protein